MKTCRYHSNQKRNGCENKCSEFSVDLSLSWAKEIKRKNPLDLDNYFVCNYYVRAVLLHNYTGRIVKQILKGVRANKGKGTDAVLDKMQYCRNNVTFFLTIYLFAYLSIYLHICLYITMYRSIFRILSFCPSLFLTHSPYISPTIILYFFPTHFTSPNF